MHFHALCISVQYLLKKISTFTDEIVFEVSLAEVVGAYLSSYNKMSQLLLLYVIVVFISTIAFIAWLWFYWNLV